MKQNGMQLFKNAIYTILSLQERFLRYRLNKTIGAKSNSKRKRHYFAGNMVDLSTLAEAERQRLEDELTLILKNYNFEPERILEYIKKQGTKVFYIENASKMLNPIGENEGFIYPSKGSRALYLALATEKAIKFKTDEMFVLSKGEINKYYFIYHLYNWFAFKHGIAGMEPEAQELLKKYLFETADTKELQLAEIYQLKDAIRQDKAAIEFVIKLCRNYDGAKQALDKMKNDGSAKL
mgnify:CR=1 FL=1